MVILIDYNNFDNIINTIDDLDYKEYINNYSCNKRIFYKDMEYINIKEPNINVLLNQLTSENNTETVNNIMELINNNEGLLPSIIDSIINCSINQNKNIDNYVKLLQIINKSYKIDIKQIIQSYFRLLNNISINDVQSYDGLCEYNNIKYRLINYSQLLYKLEDVGVINEYITIIITKLFDNLKNNTKYINIYLECLLNIFQFNPKLVNNYKRDLISIKNTLDKKRDIFLLNDIIDLCV
ncbi:MAG: hypothetical protein CMG46_01845 [Candidatus Marinimicrobia bacterium]|nr:hypothetical protein [Candidatus Neomarinimicrobiota bacterium]